MTSTIDGITAPDARPTAGLLEGVHTPDAIARHFRNTLVYISQKKALAEEGKANERWNEVDIVGALLKMGVGRG